MAERGTAGREKVWCVCGDEGGWSRGKAATQPFAGEKKKKNLSLGGDMAAGWRRKKNEGGGAGGSSFFVWERKRTLVF